MSGSRRRLSDARPRQSLYRRRRHDAVSQLSQFHAVDGRGLADDGGSTQAGDENLSWDLQAQSKSCLPLRHPEQRRLIGLKFRRTDSDKPSKHSGEVAWIRQP